MKGTYLKGLLNFFIPDRLFRVESNSIQEKERVVAIVPTYRPGEATYSLVSYLHIWNPKLEIVVVDDCTPDSDKQREVFHKIKAFTEISEKLYLIRTPNNQLKAAAINFGLNFIQQQKMNPDVVLVFDDDVIIEKDTIRNLVRGLYADERLGAVCSIAKVKNKNENLLTRLQGLEYHGFNVAKIADSGLIQGPLVMPGMLVAFRYQALRQVRGFTPNHLIEDYDITAKMKHLGWHVALVQDAVAWTNVQTDIARLWRQRIRWSYGGLKVLQDFWHYVPSVFQDLIGHGLFNAMLILVVLSLLVPLNFLDQRIAAYLLVLAIVQFLVSYLLNIWVLLHYKEADRFDWLIRLSVIPEFIYSNLLSWLLLGCYVYFIYNSIWTKVILRFPVTRYFYYQGLKIFSRLGYTTGWGTR